MLAVEHVGYTRKANLRHDCRSDAVSCAHPRKVECFFNVFCIPLPAPDSRYNAAAAIMAPIPCNLSSPHDRSSDAAPVRQLRRLELETFAKLLGRNFD